MRKCFFIVFGFGLLLVLVLGSCQKKVAPFSSQKDSIRVDTFIKVEKLYSIPNETLKQLYECDSLGNVKDVCLQRSQSVIDSLLLVAPITKKITETKYRNFFIQHDVYQKPEVKVVYKTVYKVHPITYVSFGFAIIFLFAFVICFKLLYKILKEKQK